MAQGDGFDRVHGTGAGPSKPLGPARRAPEQAFVVVWRPVPGKPWLEQSNHTPPRLRTKHHPHDWGFR